MGFTRQTRSAPRRPRPRRSDPISSFLGSFKRIRFPRVGYWGTIVGVAGLFFGTLAVTVVAAVTLRALRLNDAFNPFGADYIGIATATPDATPNPEFQAP